MTPRQKYFARRCFIFLALGTLPVLFMNFSGYLAGLGFIGFLSLALAHILF